MAAHQAPLSMGFSRQDYWNALPLPSPSNIYIWANAQNFQPLISDESAAAAAAVAAADVSYDLVTSEIFPHFLTPCNLLASLFC